MARLINRKLYLPTNCSCKLPANISAFRHWGQAEYEKLLYAWLLQEFRVGKSRNPWGFRYFELQNVCTAWENVFLPIVTAVRDSYDVRGRRHYGRLAAFIEERAPSRLAFPQAPGGGILGARTVSLPMRMLSFSKQGQRLSSHGSAPLKLSVETTPVRQGSAITPNDMDELDAELRYVSAKYGGVIERPKYKKNVKDWISAQKERANQRKLMKEENRDESPMFGCKGIDANGSPIPYRAVSYQSSGEGRSALSPMVSPSFISSGSDSTKREVTKKKSKYLGPFGKYGYTI